MLLHVDGVLFMLHPLLLLHMRVAVAIAAVLRMVVVLDVGNVAAAVVVLRMWLLLQMLL